MHSLCSVGFVEALTPAKRLHHVTLESMQVQGYTRHGLGAAVTTSQVNTALRRQQAPPGAVHSLDDAVAQWAVRNAGKRPAYQPTRPLNDHTVADITPPPVSLPRHRLAASSSSSSSHPVPAVARDPVRAAARAVRPPSSTKQGKLLQRIEELTKIRDQLLEAQKTKDAVVAVLANNQSIGKRVHQLGNHVNAHQSMVQNDWENDLVAQMGRMDIPTLDVGAESGVSMESQSEHSASGPDHDTMDDSDDSWDNLVVGGQYIQGL